GDHDSPYRAKHGQQRQQRNASRADGNSDANFQAGAKPRLSFHVVRESALDVFLERTLLHSLASFRLHDPTKTDAMYLTAKNQAAITQKKRGSQLAASRRDHSCSNVL